MRSRRVGKGPAFRRHQPPADPAADRSARRHLRPGDSAHRPAVRSTGHACPYLRILGRPPRRPPGPVPADLDVPVIGSIDLDDLYEVARTAQERLRIEVNIHRVNPANWVSSKDDPFLTHVRSQPLVELMLDEADQPSPTSPTSPDLEEP